VKAFIVTLLSKLHCDPETGWSLNGRICDGTAVLDVEFSDPVLNELVGFSAKQVRSASLRIVSLFIRVPTRYWKSIEFGQKGTLSIEKVWQL